MPKATKPQPQVNAGEYDFKSKSEWAEALESLNVARKMAPWEMARLILWGQQVFCVTKNDIMDLYDEVSEQLEVARKTLQNYASVARRFPPDEVRQRLEIGHHVVVVAMPADVADYWLDRAEDNAWSVMRLRQEIREANKVEADDDDNEDEANSGRMQTVLKALNNYGINSRGDDTTLTMSFPDGHFIVLTSPKMKWYYT